MNERHKYHAGGFADVFKHVALVRTVMQLKAKDEAFRVIDTHAGPGLYDLNSVAAQKTGAWRDGVQRLMHARLAEPVADLLAPYLHAVKELNPAGRIVRYPGSPKLVRAMLRPQDRLSAIEMHPGDADVLKTHFDGDYQTRITKLDGWLALGAHLPPKEHQGLVLVDPPFEQEGDYDRLVDGLARAYGRWHSGIYCLWYPITPGAPVADFHAKLRALGVPRILAAELCVRGNGETDGLLGCGIVLVNPPAAMETEMMQILPVLQQVLGRSEGAHYALFWLTGEN